MEMQDLDLTTAVEELADSVVRLLRLLTGRLPAALLPEEPHEVVHRPHVLGETEKVGQDVVGEL